MLRQRLTCGRPVRRGFWGQHPWRGRKGEGRGMEWEGRGGKGREEKKRGRAGKGKEWQKGKLNGDAVAVVS